MIHLSSIVYHLSSINSSCMRNRCVLLFFTLIFSLGVSAQGDERTIGQLIDSTKVKKTRFFESLTVGVDLVGPAMHLFSDHGEYQAYAQLNIKGKYLPAIEIGYGKADKDNFITQIAYKSKGMFGRIGCDFNILKNKHDDYRFMAGLRYGLTSFNYDTTLAPDSITGSRTTVSEKCTLHWAELVLGVDAKVWGPLHMGWTMRYRRRIKATNYQYNPQYAPGFGDVDAGTQIMFLYTVAVQL